MDLVMNDAAGALRMALQSFSAGRVGAAREMCRGILRTCPDHAGALHLLGVMAHGEGDRSAACVHLRRAAESPNTTALYVLSYAELCCKPVDRAAAVDAARRAIAMDGALPLGWLCLGGMLLEMRQFDECRACFERALELDPLCSQARCSLAIVIARQGDAPAAIRRFEELLRDDPGNSEARDSFAMLLQELGRYEDALTQAARAAALRPDLLDLQLRSADIELQLGRHGAALTRLEHLEKTWPREIKLLTLKAHLLRLVDRYDEAVALCRGAIGAGLESAELLRAYGLALQLAGQEALALATFDRAAAANCATALSDRGVLLAQLGRLSEACDCFDQALAREPTLADAWYNKTNGRTLAPDDPDIVAMERLLGGYCSGRDRMLLHFALGKAYMDCASADAAFAHWQEANRMKRAMIDYDADAAARQMASIAAQPLRLEAAERAAGIRLSDQPVFIVGLPRSGSSLVEQILASHSQVHGAGELTQLRALFEAATPGAESVLADAVVAGLRRHSTRARIVDKDLANFLHLGTIHRTFPRARIIHCRRDPLDTCFSAYTRLFVGDLGFTYDLRELGRYYRDYHALMAHWRRELPRDVFLEIDYETLVAEPHNETRRLLDFLGLNWEDACVRFFETERKVGTSSFAQVRRPIYRSSIGRSRPVRSYLQPLIDALGELAPDALGELAPPG
jgi:tetratricopeptide (TPR) repeat protein